MNSNERDVLAAAAAHFHQDFDLGDWSARDVFTAVARGLLEGHRTALFDGLEVMLQTHPDDSDYYRTWWALGAGMAPERSDVADFLAWGRSPEGRHMIEAPGPIASHVVVNANLVRFEG
ncbi:hypothetical protein [Phenylobacterium aquaticum]|uniref:hypothetical protein n=1 Tax=Phenylobacterium aquaticum TaxID=1763816 RepID=UPI001F5D708A|nr:hypothetical protein [Phenylobacterium aquaticum]MCI3132261.1 hypothetical protein [Phenylobacterium aquaticum]